MVNKVVDGAIKVMLAPNFGLRPQGRDRNSNGKFQKKRSHSESRGDFDRGETSGGEKNFLNRDAGAVVRLVTG